MEEAQQVLLQYGALGAVVVVLFLFIGGIIFWQQREITRRDMLRSDDIERTNATLLKITEKHHESLKEVKEGMVLHGDKIADAIYRAMRDSPK